MCLAQSSWLDSVLAGACTGPRVAKSHPAPAPWSGISVSGPPAARQLLSTSVIRLEPSKKQATGQGPLSAIPHPPPLPSS